MPLSYSPLRYPGGKSRLANYIKLIVQQNNLHGGVYAEPFSGGAGVAISLVLDGYVELAMINDIDPRVYAFWYSVLYRTDELCQKIYKIDVNVDEWLYQRQILRESDIGSILELGFATFFLNRTNRSGILNAGVIGGKHQTGQWKIDARYPKEKLIRQIEKIGALKDKISLHNLDVRNFIQQNLTCLPQNTLVYLDPPYYQKGQKLYLNALKPDDHVLIAHTILNELDTHWIVSYDNTQPVRDLYLQHRQSVFSLNYTAANRYEGSEVLIFSDKLKLPVVDNPFRLNKATFENMLAA